MLTPDSTPADIWTRFQDPELWAEAVKSGFEKKYDFATLDALTYPTARRALIEAIADGRFSFEPPRTIYKDKVLGNFISKKEAEAIEARGGKVRTLFKMNNAMDAVTCVVLSRVLFEKFGHLIHPNCRSYQRGIGVKSIVYKDLLPRLKKGMTGYKADLSKYFDSVNQETIDGLLETLKTGTPLDRIVDEMYHDDRVYLGLDKRPSHMFMSIRQGNPVGVLLADLALRDVDEEVSKLNVLYLRYSDDLLILGPDADKALALVKEMIRPKGLDLNPKKVEKIEAGKPFVFLGVKITGQTVDIGPDAVARLKRGIRLATRPHKWIKKHSRDEQKRAYCEILHLLQGHAKHSDKSWEEFYYSLVNTDTTIRTLDEFVKDHIKMVYTAKVNAHVTNIHKTSADDLRAIGYDSMVRRYKIYLASPEAYRSHLVIHNNNHGLRAKPHKETHNGKPQQTHR